MIGGRVLDVTAVGGFSTGQSAYAEALGYNAALLCHWLGDHAVCSVDIDPTLTAAAAQRLDQLGYHPTLVARDGAEGLPEHAPFDRIIATCSLRAFPTGWIHQLRPGGTALVH